MTATQRSCFIQNVGPKKQAGENKRVLQKYKDEYTSDIISKSDRGDRIARCKLCGSDFSVSHSGKFDIEKHMKTKKLVEMNLVRKNTRSLTSFFPSTTVDNSVLNAEVLFTEFLI